MKLSAKGIEPPIAREFREHSTFPLEVIELDPSGKERARMEVTKIAQASVDDSAFSLPPDYVKVDPHFGPSGSSSAEHSRTAPHGT